MAWRICRHRRSFSAILLFLAPSRAPALERSSGFKASVRCWLHFHCFEGLQLFRCLCQRERYCRVPWPMLVPVSNICFPSKKTLLQSEFWNIKLHCRLLGLRYNESWRTVTIEVFRHMRTKQGDTSGGKQLYLSQTLMPTQLKRRMDDASDPQGETRLQKEPTSWVDRCRPSAKKILTTHCAEQCVCQSRHGGTIPKMSFRNKSNSNVPTERRNLPGFDR